MAMTCPKCGFEQAEGARCERCGFMLELYGPPSAHPPAAPMPPEEAETLPEAEVVEEAKPEARPIRRLFRVLRWVIPVGLLVALFLLLRPATPPPVQTDPQAAGRVQEKVEQAGRELADGGAPTLQFTEAELNAWMQKSLVLAAPSAPVGAGPPSSKGEPTPEPVRSSIRDVKVNLLDDRVRAYVLFTLYGKNASLQLEGRLVVADGRLRLKATRGKLGSIPIPGIALDGAVSRLVNSPGNRDSFLLPPEIQDIRVVKGELIVSYKEGGGEMQAPAQ
jgi:hypothetical protein